MLKLIDVEFIGLDDIAQDRERLMAVHPALGDVDACTCKKLLKDILRAMLEGLAVSTEALDLTVLDTVGQKSRNLLRAPWAIDQQETPRSRSTLLLQAPGKDRVRLREEQTIIRAGHNSRIGRSINRTSMIGTKLNKADYLAVMTGLLELMEREGLVSRVEIEADLLGWRLSPSAVRLVPGEAVRAGRALGNTYFHDLYNAIAADLKGGRSTYWGLEGREHTAQVSQRQREWREWRFRFEDDDRAKLKENAAEIKSSGESDQFLPALFCSPTMELGVDISALNAVYLRNVPPTPANYAQRAGRAGRSGQAAVIVTYCAAQSPHDQYFFDRREDMVAGVVRPPALDITNEELVRSHLHAVWLAEAKLALSPDIPEILDLKEARYPLKQEVIEVIDRPSLATAARAPMKRVLDQIIASTDGRKPAWMGSEDDFILEVAMRAPQEFDRAFDRWRELYTSARTQLMEANSRSEITGLSGADRRKIKAAQMQASDQIAILEQGKATNGSDFYSYRYLATEGFLPGYNFPRLPLYAFVPGEGKAGSFLQRARFLAISEFGPRSLIYHEGRAYRVVKAKLPPEVRTGDGSELATKDIFICSNCGACHEGEVERCHACNSAMAGEVAVQRTLRIDNVEAAPAARITANDEERVRQGFEIQTVFSWPRKDGRLQVTEADFRYGETPMLALQYANSAEISRINKGLKRRRENAELGFGIDPRSGYWVNPWGVSFARLFDMSNDSPLFRTAAQLAAEGFARDGTDWTRGTDRFVPLYEAKMIHQFDHRWAGYAGNGKDTADISVAQKSDPGFEPAPRYWVPQAEVQDRLAARGWTRDWLMGWRDIARATDERTVIASVFPRVGVNHKMPLFFSESGIEKKIALLANFDSITLDFVARQKVGGTSLTFFYLKQFPFLPPDFYTKPRLVFITPKVLEFTYTSHSLAPFARDLGHDGPPFAWDEDRRAHLRADLDAFYARAYGLTRDDLRYILDPADSRGPDYPSETFRVLKEKEIRSMGEYRTRRLVLAAWDRMETEGEFTAMRM